jgi:hypothetical protein
MPFLKGAKGTELKEYAMALTSGLAKTTQRAMYWDKQNKGILKDH